MHKIKVNERIEDWRFERCLCGFVLAHSPKGAVYWLRARGNARILRDGNDFRSALAHYCRVNDGPYQDWKAHGRSETLQTVGNAQPQAAARPAVARCKHGLDARACAVCRKAA